jgi:site-specific DNA recombinase
MSLRAAVYSRISRDAEEDGKGVERQEEDCLALIEKRGWTLTRIYRDNDVSAAGKAKERPEYEAMLAAVDAGEVDVLVAYSNSRLSRRPAEWLELIARASTGKMEIQTVSSGKHDLTTADGRAVAMTIAVWDAAEAERVAERTTRQKAQRAADGLPQGGRYRVFGYSRKWELIDAEAALVKEAFTRRAAGESTKAIADDFAARGVLTTSDKPFKSQTLDHMFRNPGYSGQREHNGVIVAKTAYPAIVTEAEYNAVQDAMALSRRKGTNSRKWLLSGILTCSKCLSGMTGKAATNNKANARKASYKCANTFGGCGNVSITMAPVDEEIFNAAFMKAQDAEDAPVDVRDYEAEIDSLDAKIEQARASVIAGTMDLEDGQAIMNAWRKQRAEVSKEATEAAQSASIGVLSVGLYDWWDWNLSQKRLFITSYIKNVVVGPWDKADPNGWQKRLTIRYTDGTSGGVDGPGIIRAALSD